MICDGGDSSKKELVIIRYPDPYRTCIHTEIPSTKGFCWKDVIKTGLEQHFEEILRFWPGLQPDEWKKNPVTPNISSFVFAKAKAAIEGVMLDDANDDEEALVDLQNGSQMIISYNSISQLVKNDEVCLI